MAQGLSRALSKVAPGINTKIGMVAFRVQDFAPTIPAQVQLPDPTSGLFQSLQVKKNATLSDN